MESVKAVRLVRYRISSVWWIGFVEEVGEPKVIKDKEKE